MSVTTVSRPCSARLANWHDEADQEALRTIRHSVFVSEQNVPEELEWTGDDSRCIHALVRDADGQNIATGRLDPDGHIGRMAVLKSHRGLGAGQELLRFLVEQARQRNDREVLLSAQIHALDFYRRAGFEAYGTEFMDAGIPHKAMLKYLR